MQAHCGVTSLLALPLAAERLCKYYGDSPLLIISEVRLNETGITTHLQECFQVTYWPSSEGKDNLLKASKANIGMTCVRLTAWCSSLPQSKGTPSVCFPVLFYIKSDVTQLARILRQRAQSGEQLPSCINIISGPNSTADTELIKVVECMDH